MRLKHDWLGEVVLPEYAQRIVSLAPSITETLFALGLGGRTVGRSVYCYRPAEALALPTLSSYTRLRWDLLEQLQPDLILISTGIQRELLNELLARKLPIFPVPLVHSPYGILENILLVGELTGAGVRASQLCAELSDRYAKLHQILPPIRVYLELDLGGPTSVGRGSYITEALRHLGLDNVLSQHPQSYFAPDLALIERLMPQLVILEPKLPRSRILGETPARPFSEGANGLYQRQLERARARMGERGWSYPLLVNGGDELTHYGPMFFEYLEALERRIERMEIG
ncbi:MAG: ABC transporter substrate-binding protein [Meiothermus sp.]|nr:ABC transporter substrate-binding protein [Meiothermus sp.]